MLSNLHIALAEPYWLLLIPGMLLLIFSLQRRGHRPVMSLTHWLADLNREVYLHPKATLLENAQAKSESKTIRQSIYLPLLHLLLVVSLLSLALAQPYRIGKRLPDPPEHRDVVFLLDTSVSMVLRDYVVEGKRIDRLTMLKHVLAHFVDKLHGNRIQLIAYAEEAYTLVPLTNDYALLKFQLQRLQAATLTGRSSDLSHALLYAASQYPESGAQDTKPVFVMLTDASRPDRRIDPRVAAEYIAQQGIRLHTIAIGAGSYEAEDTTHVTLIYHPTNFQLLEDIAARGKGSFFWAKDTASLADALARIQETEKRTTKVEPMFIKEPLYFWPLSAGVGWLLLLYVTTLLRRKFAP